MPYPEDLNKEDRASLDFLTGDNPNFEGVYWLTPQKLPQTDSYNCWGWAVNQNDFTAIPAWAEGCLEEINRLMKPKVYELTAPDDLNDAEFILWGTSINDVEHISVLLTYEDCNYSPR
ncbi:hypothetical protein SG34_031495 [Thalassomonas viridans]|uniref:Uncharacterized protein n=1 Tax=Thalassomonas viridans TaxID=137584 RepID=A0AAE9ZCD7_9GAMM|nr:hypothetical protein [Thalassomonas viridans]WDE09289.1 hypothetical protein SG34_031495 [Thalassomonas viridans]